MSVRVDRAAAGTARPRPARIRSRRAPPARGDPRLGRLGRGRDLALVAAPVAGHEREHGGAVADEHERLDDPAGLAADRERGRLRRRRPLRELLHGRVDRGGAQERRDPLHGLGPQGLPRHDRLLRRERAARTPRRPRGTATPRSMSAPSSVSESSTAASAAAMSKTSNQPMWPMRKIFPLRCPCPGASVTPCSSRRCLSSSVPSMPSGSVRDGDHRGGVVVGREELEPHRLQAGARGAAEPDVPLERGLEAVARRCSPSATSRPRISETAGVNAASKTSLRLPRAAPVEVEAARLRQPVPEAVGDARHREPGRAHQRLLRAGEDDVDAPRVGLERDRAERRDRVDDEHRVADRGLQRLHVGDDAGRGLGLGAEDDAGAALGDCRADLVGGRHLAPVVREPLHVEAVLLADRDPALAERAGGDDRDAVGRRAEVRDGGVHRAGARRR